MTEYFLWMTITSAIRSHLVHNSLSELDPDGLLTVEQVEKLTDRLDTLTIKSAREFLGESCVVYADGTVFMKAGALSPDDPECVVEKLNTHLAEVDYDSCYENL